MTQPSKDTRLNVTSKIWAFATGMLAICIPLSAATDSGPVIPIAVIAGAAVGTASVWKSGDRKSADRIEISDRIKVLEGRIADLETIITAGDIEWQRKIASSTNSVVSSKTIAEGTSSRD
jgi:hypothetical protein